MSKVSISYEVEIGDSKESVELPFVVIVLADLAGQPLEPLPRIKERKLLQIDQNNFDLVLEEIRPRLRFVVRNTLLGGEEQLPVELFFKNMAGFDPANVLWQVPPLGKLLETRTRLDHLRRSLNDKLEDLLLQALHDPETLSALRSPADDGSPILDRIVQEGGLGQDEEILGLGREWVQEFFSQVQDGEMPFCRDLNSMILRRVTQIDEKISAQLNEILHAPPFQALEASWRGVQFLVRRTGAPSTVRIKVLNVSKKELLRSLQSAGSPEGSVVFKKVYGDEMEFFRGAPTGLLVGDYYFFNNPEDVDLLDRISAVAQESHTPFIAAAGAGLFNMDDFSELNLPRVLAKIFQSTEFSGWKRFRNQVSSRYVGLVLPRILMREPYQPGDGYVTEFNYNEGVDGTDNIKYLWGNPIYAFCTNLTNAFQRYGWLAAIRGAETGGLVKGIPVHRFQSPEGDWGQRGPLEVSIPDRREKELSDLGFVALCDCKRTDQAIIYDVPSCLKAKWGYYERFKYSPQKQLECILVVCHLMHGILANARDQIRIRSASEMQELLNTWLKGYVASQPASDEESAARHPLKGGRVEVTTAEGKGGGRMYEIMAYLQPSYQLMNLTFPLGVRALVTTAWK